MLHFRQKERQRIEKIGILIDWVVEVRGESVLLELCLGPCSGIFVLIDETGSKGRKEEMG